MTRRKQANPKFRDLRREQAEQTFNDEQMDDYKEADDDMEDDDDLAPLVIETPNSNSPSRHDAPAFPVPVEVAGDDDDTNSIDDNGATPKSISKPARQPSPNKSRKKGDKIQPVGIAPDGSVHFKCPVCNIVLQSQHDLTKHIRTHNTISASPGSSNTCTICGKILSSQSSLDRHMLVHSGERPFQCKYCSMAFTTNGNMHRHMRIHAKEGTATPTIKKTKRKSEPQEVSPVTVKKQPKVGNQSLPPSPEKSTPSKMTPSLANECPVQECGKKSFLTAYGLDAHMKTCHSNLILQCPICFIPCSSRRTLFQHVATAHNALPKKKKMEEDENREEVWCDKNKLADTDDAEKRFECSICDGQFPSEDTLKVHKSWHAIEGQMASRCTVCDVDFEKASELDEHEIRHVKDAVLKKAEVKHDIREEVSREEFLAAFDLKVNKENQEDKKLQQASYINRLQKMIENGPLQPLKSELHPAFGSPPFPAVTILSDVAKKYEYPFPQGSPSPVKDENPRPYVCRLCRINFSSKSNVEKHLQTKHGVLVKDEIETAISCFSPQHLVHQNSPSPLQLTSPNSKSSVRFECRLCNAYYDRRADCVRHVTQQHSNVPCGIVDTQIAQVPVTQQETPIDLSVKRNRKNSSPVRSGVNLTHFCEICRAGFTDVEDLQRHIQAKHMEDKEIVSSTFVKERLRERLEVNNNNEFFTKVKKNSYSDSPHKHVCPHCYRAFPWESSLKRHVLTHTGQKPFKCPCCSVYFSTKSNRERHVARKHGLDVQDKLTKMLMELAHACSYCTNTPQRFSTSEQLLAHYSVFHPDKPLPEEAQGRSYQDEDDDADVSSRSTSPEATSTSAECGKCGVVLPSRNLLTRHNREEHRSEVAFRCHLCDASFQDRRACAEHVVAKHPEVWNAVSEKNGYDDVQALCDAVDATSGNHRDDYDEKRIQAAKVACFACRKRFGSLQDLRRHMATHTGERAFVCPLCAKRFSFKHSLRRHMRRHEINEASDSNPASPTPETAKA